MPEYKGSVFWQYITLNKAATPDKAFIRYRDHQVTWRRLFELGEILWEQMSDENADILVIPAREDNLPQYVLVAACLVNRIPFVLSHIEDVEQDAVIQSACQLSKPCKITIDALGEAVWCSACMMVSSVELHQSDQQDGALLLPAWSDVIYVGRSSGTTGIPKLVPVTARSFDDFLPEVLTRFPLKDSDVMGDFAQMPSDMTITNLILCLAANATWVPLCTIRDRMMLFNSFSQHGVTCFRSVASSLNFINACISRGMPLPDTFKWFCFGGERLTWQALSLVFESNLKAQVFNSFGATELAGFVTLGEVEPEGLDQRELVHQSISDDVEIGPFFDDVKYSFHARQSLHLTSARFPHYFIQVTGGKAEWRKWRQTGNGQSIIATGDQVVIDNNQLFVTGRTDSLIKLKGQFINIENEEYAVYKATGLKCLIHINDADLTLFFRQQDSDEVQLKLASVRTAIAHLGLQLSYHFVDQFPETPSGKIQRRLLPQKPLDDDEEDEMLSRKFSSLGK